MKMARWQNATAKLQQQSRHIDFGFVNIWVKNLSLDFCLFLKLNSEIVCIMVDIALKFLLKHYISTYW